VGLHGGGEFGEVAEVVAAGVVGGGMDLVDGELLDGAGGNISHNKAPERGRCRPRQWVVLSAAKMS
jgi:hypothetical protein